MKNVQVDFDVKDEGGVAPVGYKEIRCHPIFDIKATTLTWKVIFVAGGHTMYTPADMIYAFVVSQEILWIAFLIRDLNSLDVFSADVHNAYLNAPPRDKAWFKAGPECGQYEGRVIVISRALYGMVSSAAS